MGVRPCTLQLVCRHPGGLPAAVGGRRQPAAADIHQVRAQHIQQPAHACKRGGSNPAVTDKPQGVCTLRGVWDTCNRQCSAANCLAHWLGCKVSEVFQPCVCQWGSLQGWRKPPVPDAAVLHPLSTAVWCMCMCHGGGAGAAAGPGADALVRAAGGGQCVRVGARPADRPQDWHTQLFAPISGQQCSVGPRSGANIAAAAAAAAALTCLQVGLQHPWHG